MRFKASAVLAVLALVVGLAGCGGHPSRAPSSPIDTSLEPQLPTAPPTRVHPSPSATPTPSMSGAIALPSGVATAGANVSPGDKPPAMLPGTEENTPGGAVQFAVYWMMSLDWGYATRDSTLARSLFSSACTDCSRFMNIFDNARQQGLQFIGGRFEITSDRPAPNDGTNGASQAVDVDVSTAALQVTDVTGKVVEADPALPDETYRVWVAWIDGRWTVVSWKRAVHK